MAETQQLSQAYLSAYIGNRLIGIAVALIPVLIVFVSLRFYARRLSKTPHGLDDYLVLISLVFQIGASGLAIGFVKYGGVGHHFDALLATDPAITTTYFKYLLAVSIYYWLTVSIPKLAILALYMRIFTLKQYRTTVYVVAGIVIATALVCTIVSLNSCHPFAYNWTRLTSNGHCLNENLFFQFGSLPNILTDIAMLILPLPIIWRLQITRNTKIGLTITFLTGSLGLATSIVRFASFSQRSAISDGTWASVDLMTWTLIEPDVYLIAACLPTYHPLFQKFFTKTRPGKPLESSQSSSSGIPKRFSQDVVAKDRSTPARLEDCRESQEEVSVGDQIRLIQLNQDKQYNQKPAGDKQIRVQKEYDVISSKRDLDTWQ